MAKDKVKKEKKPMSKGAKVALGVAGVVAAGVAISAAVKKNKKKKLGK